VVNLHSFCFVVVYFKMKYRSDIILFILATVSTFTFFFHLRYGKRTTQGIVNDLWNALARYYLNNFVDGTKQVSIDFAMMPPMPTLYDFA